MACSTQLSPFDVHSDKTEAKNREDISLNDENLLCF